MPKLFRYIAIEFILYAFYCIFSFVTLFVLFDTLMQAGKGEFEKTGWPQFISNILAGIPLAFDLIAPLTALLATILSFSTLSKNSEIVAMQAAGLGTRQITLPVITASIILSYFTYLNQSYLARWLDSPSRLELTDNAQKKTFWQFHQNHLFAFYNLTPKTKQVEQIIDFQLNQKDQIAKINHYHEVRKSGNNWTVLQSYQKLVENGAVHFSDINNSQFNAIFFPKIFSQKIETPIYYPFMTLFREIRTQKKSGADTHAHIFIVYKKIAGILSIPIMVILAVPFSLFSARKSNVGQGLIIAVVLGLLAMLTNHMFAAFYEANILPALVGAFGPNIVFLILALCLTYLKRE